MTKNNYFLVADNGEKSDKEFRRVEIIKSDAIF